jgi:hypothetical protein
MTFTNNNAVQGLTGNDLLERIKELGDINKADLVRACGYTTFEADGTEEFHYTLFYMALLDAKGIDLGEAEVAAEALQEKETEEPLLSGLSIEGFSAAVLEHIYETHKLLPNDPYVVDKVNALLSIASLLAFHQRAVQKMEQEGKNTEAWISDIERLRVCLNSLKAVDLGDNDHWYEPEQPARELTVDLKTFTDVVKKANGLQTEVDQLKQQLDECQAKKGGLLHWLFPATF